MCAACTFGGLKACAQGAGYFSSQGNLASPWVPTTYVVTRSDVALGGTEALASSAFSVGSGAFGGVDIQGLGCHCKLQFRILSCAWAVRV